MMKKIVLIAALCTSLLSFGQCTDCKSLKEAMTQPQSVTSLRLNPYFDGVVLRSFPDSIRLMKNLRILFLTDQQLTSIPSFVGELKGLNELSFAGNKLTSLPEEIFTLTSLRELILLDNPFPKDYISYIKKQCREKLPNTKLLIESD